MDCFHAFGVQDRFKLGRGVLCSSRFLAELRPISRAAPEDVFGLNTCLVMGDTVMGLDCTA